MSTHVDSYDTLLSENARLRARLAEYEAAAHRARQNSVPEHSTSGEARAEAKWQTVEEARRTSEERLSLFAHATNDALYDWDVRTGQVWSNDAYVQQFGTHPSGLADDMREWSERLHPDERERVKHDLDASLAAGANTWTAEYHYRRTDGSYAYVLDRMHILRGADGQVTRMLGAMLDLTKRRQTEDALRASEEKFSKAFGLSPVLLCLTSLDDGRVIDVNQTLLDAAGCTRDDVLGRTPVELGWWVRPEDRERGLDVLRQQGRVSNQETVFRMKDGQHRLYLHSIEVIEIGGRACVLTALVDITERKLAEERLRLLVELGERMRRAEDPEALLFVAAQTAGDHVQAKRAFFIEMDVSGDRARIHRQYCRGVPPVASEYSISDYSDVTLNDMRAGRTVVNDDAQTDPRTAARYESVYRPNGERAYVAVPLLREGNWVATLWVSDDLPRRWSTDQVTLLETVAERAWLVVENARLLRETQAALRQARQSEAFNRAIFESSPDCVKVLDGEGRLVAMNGQGLCLMEIDDFSMFAGKPWEMLWPEDARGGVRKALEIALAGGTGSFQSACPTAKGTPKWWDVLVSAVPNSEGKPSRLISVSRDVTEQKRAEHELRHTTALLRGVSETTSDLIYVKDRAGRLLLANPATLRAIGQTAEAVLGKNEAEWHGDKAQAAQLMDTDRRVMETGQTEVVEETFTGPDGARVYLSTKSPLRDEHGDIVGLVGVSHDLTNRKRNEEAVRENQQMLALAMRGGRIGSWWRDLATDAVWWSRELEEIFGLAPNGFAGSEEGFYAYVYADDQPLIARAVEAAIEGRTDYAVEFRFRRADGSTGWMEGRGRAVYSPDDQPLRLYGIGIDITERKQAEDALRESEARLRLALESGRMGAWDWDLKTGAEMWSPEQDRLFGFEAGGTARRIEMFFRQVHPEDLPGIQARADRAAAQGKDYVEDEFRIRLPDGTERWIASRARLHRDSSGQVVRMTGVNMDVTELKEAEEKLRKSEARQSFLLKLGDALRLLADPTAIQAEAARVLGQHLRANRVTYAEVQSDGRVDVKPGYAEGVVDIAGQYWLDHYNPVLLRHFRAGMTHIVNDMADDPNVTAAAERAEGETLTIRAAVTVPVLKDRALIALLGVHYAQPHAWTIDEVSLVEETAERTWGALERARAEAALRESEARLQQMADAMPQLVWMAGSDGAVNYYNRRVTEFDGVAQAADGTWAWQPALHADDVEATTVAWQAATAAERPYTMEHRLRMVDGSYRWHLSRAYPGRDASGRITIWYGTATDIHDLKQVEAKLETANYRFRVAEEAARGFSYEWDLTTDTVVRSDGLTAVLGYGQGELPDTWEAWAAIMHPDAMPMTKAQAIEFITQYPDETFGYEYRARHKDGSYRWLYERAIKLKDDKGNLRRVIGQTDDITERKQAEEHLRIANERFRMAEDASNGFLYDLNLTTNAEARSENFTNVLGYSDADVPGGGAIWEALIHPDDVARVHDATATALASGAPGARYEYRIRHKDGRWLWVLDENIMVRDGEGVAQRIVGSIVDITARKVAEERLRRLQAVTVSLLQVHTLDEVRRVILDDVVSALGSGAGGLRRVAGEALVLDTYELGPHFNENDIRRFAVVPLDAPHPAADAVRTGEAVFASDAQDVIRRYPHLAEVVRGQKTEAIAHLPLKRGNQVFAVLSLPFVEPHAWDDSERAFALALAGRATVAYERARLFEAERQAKERAERLQSVTARLATALTSAEVVQVVLEVGPPALDSNAGLVVRLDGNELEVVDAVGYPARLTQPWQRFPISAATPISEAVRTGVGVWVESPDDFQRRFNRLPDPATLAISQSWVALPLAAGGRTLGALGLSYGEPRIFDPDSRRFAETLADLCAQALERTRLFEAVRASETRFRAVQDTSIDGFMVLDSVRDETGRIVDFCWRYANEAAERIVGQPRDWFIGRRLLEAMPGNREAGLFDAYVRVVETGEPWTHEFEYQYEGLDVYLRLVAAKANDGFAVTFADLSERRRTEQEIAERETRFRQLADAMPQIVFTNDALGQVNYLNRQWLDYTGLTLEDSLRDPVAPMHPDDISEIGGAWAENLRRGEPFEQELRLRRHDGPYRWFLSRSVPARDAGGRITGWYGTSTDIHERKQAELDAQFLADLGQHVARIADPAEMMAEAVRATAERLRVDRVGFITIDTSHNRATIEHDYCSGVPSIAGTYPLAWLGPQMIEEMHAGIPLVIADTRRDRRTAFVDGELLAPLGIRSGVSVPLLRNGRCVATLFVSHHEPRTWAESEVALLQKVGERVWLAAESARLHAETQALNTTLEARVAERTAALHESQAQLRKLSAHAERTRENERTRIAREVHDELGGALTALKMTLARTRKGRDDDTDLVIRLSDMRSQIDELVQLVRRVASDLRPPLLDDFGLLAALEWQAQEWEKRTGIACTLTLSPQSEEVTLDRECRTAVFRVFQESLTNVARHAQATRVTATVQHDGGQLVLTVHDDGRGIDAEALRPGKSLGLLGMRERMREVAGDLDITGAPGEGTTVTVRVPIDGRGGAGARGRGHTGARV